MGNPLDLDGFTIYFFKFYWEIVKKGIYELMPDSQESTTILKTLNSMFITVIPKKELASTLENFRLIALCNVLYKIISKVAANKMKTILPYMISEENSSFVEGR